MGQPRREKCDRCFEGFGAEALSEQLRQPVRMRATIGLEHKDTTEDAQKLDRIIRKILTVAGKGSSALQHFECIFPICAKVRSCLGELVSDPSHDGRLAERPFPFRQIATLPGKENVEIVPRGNTRTQAEFCTQACAGIRQHISGCTHNFAKWGGQKRCHRNHLLNFNLVESATVDQSGIAFSRPSISAMRSEYEMVTGMAEGRTERQERLVNFSTCSER